MSESYNANLCEKDLKIIERCLEASNLKVYIPDQGSIENDIFIDLNNIVEHLVGKQVLDNVIQ